MAKLAFGVLVTSMILGIVSQPSAAQQKKVKPSQMIAYSESRRGPAPTFNPFDPLRSTDRLYLMYERLAYYDQNSGEFRGWLAENWNWTGPRTFNISLRPEAEWRDGTEVTAEDVVFSLKTHANPQYSAGVLFSFFKKVKSIEAVGKKELEVQLIDNLPKHYQRIKTEILWSPPIVPKERWQNLIEEKGENLLDFTNKNTADINASGPYILSASTSSADFFKRVNNYWGNEIGWYFKPQYFKTCWWGSASTALRMFRETDQSTWNQHGGGREALPDLLKREDISCWNEQAILKTGKLTANAFRGPDIGFDMVMNLKKPIFKNKWLRYALAYAIDYKALIKRCQPGAFINSPAYISPRAKGVGPYIARDLIRQTFETQKIGGVLGLKQDKQKAISLLKEHCEGSVEKGWTYDGKKIGGWTIIAVNGWEDVMTQAKVVSRYWSKIGIETTCKFLSYGNWVSNIKNWNYDIYCGYNTIKPPFGALRNLVNYLTISSKGGYSVWNTPIPYPDIYPDKASKIEQKLQEMWTLPSGSEKAIQIAKEIQEIYVPQLYMIPCYGRPTWGRWKTNHWVNWPTQQDPTEHSLSMFPSTQWLLAKHLQPRSVETTNVSVSPAEAKPGEPISVEVTLKNSDEVKHKYAVKVKKGPAQVGQGPEVLAHAGPIIPANGTKTVSLEISFSKPGSYTITVDDWRAGPNSDDNPGNPIEKNVIVTKAGKAMISPTNLTLSKSEVEPGESTTISADVSNEGNAKGSKTIEITLDGETVKSEAVKLEPGETTTVSAIVSKSAEGTYTVKVGELTRTLTVKKRKAAIPPGLSDKVRLAIRMAENARDAAVSAGSSAQEAKSAAESAESAATSAQSAAQEAKAAAQEAKAAAQEAKAAAQEAKAAAQEAGGAPTSMVIASMVITIVVVLAGVYVITRHQAT